LDTTIPLIKTNKNAKYYRTYLLTIREELSEAIAKSKSNVMNQKNILNHALLQNEDHANLKNNELKHFSIKYG
jgi:hypothetical protein